MRTLAAAAWITLALSGCLNTESEPVERARPDPAPETSDAEPSQVDANAAARGPVPTIAASKTPAVPTLAEATLPVTAQGTFALPEDTDELAPHTVVRLGDGSLWVAGQVYRGRRPGTPSPTWRWTGIVRDGDATASTRHGEGAIRTAIPTPEGGAWAIGSRGKGFGVRGWFGVVDPAGQLSREVDLDSPNSTELFAIVPGAGAEAGELAVVAGYVDAQAWVVSLADDATIRWQRYLGSHGYTQARGLQVLDDGRLLTVGSRGQEFGEFWSAIVPATGSGLLGSDDAEQFELEVEGADINQSLYAIVDLGGDGLLALGTTKRGHRQAHDQVVAIGFDRAGAPTWSRIVPDVRATAIVAGAADGSLARFVLAVPSEAAAEANAVALVSVAPGADGAVVARRVADTVGWSSAGFVDGRPDAIWLHGPADEGLAWRVVDVAP